MSLRGHAITREGITLYFTSGRSYTLTKEDIKAYLDARSGDKTRARADIDADIRTNGNRMNFDPESMTLDFDDDGTPTSLTFDWTLRFP